MKGPRAAPGSVLIFALWVILFMATLTVAVSTSVSVALTAARSLRTKAAARHLAEAGVGLAVAEIMSATGAVASSELTDNEARFRENRSVEGGAFSVSHVIGTNIAGEAAFHTNYGVSVESAKLRLDKADAGELGRLMIRYGGVGEERDAMEIAGEVVRYKREKSEKYRADFELLHELLQVESVRSRAGLFAGISPHLTLHGDVRRACYAAIASGRPDEDSREVVRISFVVDTEGAVLFWHEY